MAGTRPYMAGTRPYMAGLVGRAVVRPLVMPGPEGGCGHGLLRVTRVLLSKGHGVPKSRVPLLHETGRSP